MSHERICILDKTKYEYCGHCKKYNQNETWRYIYCCENCKDIFDVITKFRGGFYDKATAKVMLNPFDLSKIDTFEDRAKATLTEILDSDVATESVETESEVEVEPETEITEEPKDEIVVEPEAEATEESEVSFGFSRKKNRKRD